MNGLRIAFRNLVIVTIRRLSNGMGACFLGGYGFAWVAGIWLFATACPGLPQSAQVHENTQTNALAGTYVAGIPVRLTLELRTNGTYEVQSERATQRGTWAWDAKRLEFSLRPTSGKFPFELRRLRVDRHEPGCLQWLPVSPLNGGPGAIDYVRFMRQKD